MARSRGKGGAQPAGDRLAAQRRAEAQLSGRSPAGVAPDRPQKTGRSTPSRPQGRRDADRRSWLEGPEIRGSVGSYPGEGLGLPQDGPGSVATVGRRTISILLDFVVARLVTLALHLPSGADIAVFAVYSWLLLGTLGQTIPMFFLKLRLIGGGGRPPGVGWALLRTVLTVLVVPVFFLDSDRRGLHDRAAGTVVVKA